MEKAVLAGFMGHSVGLRAHLTLTPWSRSASKKRR
jgi:hypothetical protein